jgi:hypothetical protein
LKPTAADGGNAICTRSPDADSLSSASAPSSAALAVELAMVLVAVTPGVRMRTPRDTSRFGEMVSAGAWPR